MGIQGGAFALVGVLCACGGGGDGWTPVSSTPQAVSVTDVWAFSETDVWFVDGGPAVHRYDGERFTTLDTPGSGLLCIFALSATDVYLCAGGDVLHWDGSSFAVMDVSTATGLTSITDLWASSPSDVWAVGDDAIVAHYDGSAWTRTVIDSSFNSSVWGSGPSDVYAMGTFDLVHYDGQEWTVVDLPGSGAGDGQVWGTGASDVWVMTESYSLLHYDGGAWEEIETENFVGDLSAVWGPAPDDVWAVGSAGSIAHYDGASWTEVAHQPIGAPYLRMFVAVHGSSSTDVWTVGHQLGEGGSTGLIYHGP